MRFLPQKAREEMQKTRSMTDDERREYKVSSNVCFRVSFYEAPTARVSKER